MNNFDEINFFMNFFEQNWDLREAHDKSLTEMEELKRFQGSTFKNFSKRKLIEELQNEANCLNDLRDFKDAESVRSGLSHVPSQPALFPLYRDPGGMRSRLGRMLSRKEGSRSIWDTPGFSGNVFANPLASSSAPYPQELNPWCTTVEEPLHTSTVEKSERPEQNQDLRCQSGPSAKSSVIPCEGRFSKNCGADQQRLQISDLHFDNSLHQPRLFAGR